MTCSLGKQILGQYKECLLITMRFAQPCHQQPGMEGGLCPDQGHYEEGTFLCQ